MNNNVQATYRRNMSFNEYTGKCQFHLSLPVTRLKSLLCRLHYCWVLIQHTIQYTITYNKYVTGDHLPCQNIQSQPLFQACQGSQVDTHIYGQKEQWGETWPWCFAFNTTIYITSSWYYSNLFFFLKITYHLMLSEQSWSFSFVFTSDASKTCKDIFDVLLPSPYF